MKKPWHLWLVGVVTLVLNAGGGFDYIMTQTKNAEYMAGFTSEQLDFFYGFPTWAVICWALSVWTGVLGSILLLFGLKLSVMMFAISLLTFFGAAAHTFFLSSPNMLDIMGAEAIYITAFILAIAVLTFVYARQMALRGVLK